MKLNEQSRYLVVAGLRGAGLLCLLLPLAGCDAGKPMAEVSGRITYDGKPVEKGAITFFPLDGKASTAGTIIVDGGYKALVPFGEMKVTISSPKIIGRRKLYANNPNSPEMDIPAEALPLRYNERSELKMTIGERVINRDFELTK